LLRNLVENPENMPFHRLCCGLSLLALVLLAIPSAFAQYRVHSWVSFEDGAIPKDLVMELGSGPDTVQPYAYSTPGTPPVMTSGIASLECGTTGMIFKPVEKKRFLGVIAPISLDRRQLGSLGKALYQVDVYLPPPGEPIPNTALLALVPDPGAKNTSKRKMYRFGFSKSGEALFFAYADNESDVASGKPLALSQSEAERLQAQAAGLAPAPDDLRGTGGHLLRHRPAASTKFSPVKEKSLSVLNAA
jgi:hypothetical protein